MRHLPRVLFALALFTVCPVGAQTYPPAFPRTNVTKLLETDRIVVWDVVWPKGQPTALHRHVYDQVGTYYQTGGRIVTTPDGASRSTTTQVGALSTTRKGTTHIEEGATDPPLRAVFIELKNETGSGQPEIVSNTPSVFALGGRTPRLDDDRVLVWDVAWIRGAPGVESLYSRDTILVWLDKGTMRLTRQGGLPIVVDVAPGQIRRHSRGAIETAEAIAGSPRAMLFAFK